MMHSLFLAIGPTQHWNIKLPWNSFNKFWQFWSYLVWVSWDVVYFEFKHQFSAIFHITVFVLLLRCVQIEFDDIVDGCHWHVYYQDSAIEENVQQLAPLKSVILIGYEEVFPWYYDDSLHFIKTCNVLYLVIIVLKQWWLYYFMKYI